MPRFYVTTPIYYVNDVPHIGHAYTTVAGDVLTRWRRLWGDEVFYLTGTDEHGLKVQRAAEARGVTPKELVDETAGHFRDTWDGLDIAYDDFIRTTEPRHYAAVQTFLQTIYDAGDIELGTYEGLYCVSCEAYYAEDELVDGCCPIHLRPVEHVVEENYFFKLSRFTDRLLAHYAEHPDAVQPETRMNEVLGFIRGGLQDFSMSRTSITWGVPLPWDPKHVAYVWADALFNYCTAVGYATDDARFAKWWPVDYHLVGKDILRFHAVYWPAMLMSAGLEPPRCVFAHGWLLVGGEKMSKTRLNQIAPADLANNFGNRANRVLNMAMNYCAGVVPDVRADGPLREAAAAAFSGQSDALTRLDFAGGFGAVWELIRVANAYIEDTKPWELNKQGDAQAVARVLGDCLESLRIVALLASPLIPNAAGELWRRLGLTGRPEGERLPDAAAWGRLPAGATLDKGAPLFPRKDT